MRRTQLTRSLVVAGFVAFAGAGCDQVTAWYQQEVQHHGGSSSTGSGAAGSSGGGTGAAGASGTSGICVAEMGATGTCKRCYDVNGVLVHEDCPPPGDPGGSTGTGGSTEPPLPPKCGQTTDASGQICKTCWDAVTGQVISNDCGPSPAGTGGTGGSQTCITIDDGGASSCKDAGTWKQYGSDRCAQQKLALTDVKYGIACTGGYSMVTYVCCGPDPTPPPSPVVTCESWVDADGAVCKQCRNESGAVISLDCQGGNQPPNEICDVKTNADGSQCKTCYYSDGTTVSSCPTAP